MKKHRDAAFFLRYLCSFFLLAIVLITLAQVFSRFVLNSPFIWADELSRFLLVWMVFIGVGAVSFDDRHLAVNLFQEMMSPKVKLISDIIMRGIIIIFLIVVAYTSIDIVVAAHNSSTGALSIPFSFWRVAAPVGAVLMIVFTIIRTINDIKDYRTAETEHS
ncbi:TRAP transporter small permease [Salipaludibacillus aurantiacus]|uniref:TRAP-type C4-dicarboxylate transport system, small permease component n=1 Tax=Salipaludibacillus aurantiacus TaxID=1601833 RepID=A0A1H9VX99_9BACI|nr:TRAP transporter small permease [Salipaludibacillus aurantiacus]SES26420.1 TRAP-type C4-dicarboxylate transport system, small permease component [Salipaludibacillus aurantiacus]